VSVRLPSLAPQTSAAATALDSLGYEIMAEKAAALGRAGDRAGQCLVRLHACEPGSPERPALLKEAAQAVHAWFIQREICGLRRHQDVIRDLRIPHEVLVRLGAS
jgi:hypothetical protein